MAVIPEGSIEHLSGMTRIDAAQKIVKDELAIRELVLNLPVIEMPGGRVGVYNPTEAIRSIPTAKPEPLTHVRRYIAREQARSRIDGITRIVNLQRITGRASIGRAI